MKILKYIIVVLIGVTFTHCDYLDVVPDNVATIDNAFSMRSSAEKYLFTCYKYMPSHGDLNNDPAFTAGDEFWYYYPFLGFSAPGWEIARGNQSSSDPILNYWDSNKKLWVGIRDCNIFLENISKVEDLDAYEMNQWIGEVKFLKAYYHFWLLRMYGPIPIIRENLPISAGVEDVKVERRPVDECFAYIEELLDEAIADLPETIEEEITDLGRITKPIAMSVKALVLSTAASPLFNGNSDYLALKNNDGTVLFNSTYDENKWIKAAEACQKAIDQCHLIGMELYKFNSGISQYDLSDETMIKMSIRNSVCEKWNSEIIWANTNSKSLGTQIHATPAGLDPSSGFVSSTKGNLAPPIKIVEMFYTKNGIPINEDNSWDYSNRYETQVVTEDDKYNLQPGYATAKLHFDRELRFYADLAFDGAWWFGQGRLDDDNQWPIQCKMGQYQTRQSLDRYSITGYWPKKLVSYKNSIGQTTYTIEQYPWPVMRLADLYLLCSEALNEAYGSSDEALSWINQVRERAGLKSVEESWSQFSKYPTKYQTKEGLRDIIQRERLIELSFEGHRFWDIKRWKKGIEELNNPITGWDVEQESTELYNRVRNLYVQKYRLRDYFWPIKDYDLIVNRNLVQNIGW